MRYGLFALAAFGASMTAAASAQHHSGAHSPSGPVVIRHGGPAAGPIMARPHGPTRVEIHRRGVGGHGGGHFSQRRFQRGFIIPSFFHGPQFHVRNWQLYGFAPPPRDHRWVRHHDDAYLIDNGGRIRDHRYGLEWDRYGERWAMTNGIPSYGDDDFGPDDFEYGDYADEDHAGPRGGHAGHHGCGECERPMRVRTFVPPPHHPAPYGYGWGQPIIVETTVTTGGATVTTEIVEEVVETRRRPVRRHHRPARPSKLIHGERG